MLGADTIRAELQEDWDDEEERWEVGGLQGAERAQGGLGLRLVLF